MPLEHVRLSVQKTGAVRSVEFQGRPFRVFPAVLVREQVLNNNLGKTFLPSAEIQASVEAWNGIPVVIRHPKDESARSPEILNERGVGILFNARYDDALRAEVYLEDARVALVEGADVAVANVESEAGSELSTGFFTRLDRTAGVFNGAKYNVVLRDIRPDHLALLPDEIGACSVQDGCGLGVNHAGPCDVPEVLVPAAPAHDAEKVAVAIAQQPAWRRILNRAARILGFQPAENESDDDRRELVSSALREKFGGDDRFVWVASMDSTTGVVVWSVEVQGEGDGGGLFQASFEIGEDGAVSIGEPSKVRRVTTFEPAANAPGDQTPTEEAMNREQMIAQLAANGRDKETLAKLSDCDIKALFATLNAKPEAPKEDPETIAHLQEQLIAERKKNERLEVETATAVNAEKKELTDKQVELIANGNTAYTPTEIRAMNIVQIRKLYDTVFPRRADFLGRGVPRAANNTTSDFSFARRSTMGGQAAKEA